MNANGTEWITVPETLLSAVAKTIDPNPTDRATHAVTDVPRKLIEALIEYMSEDLGCDHSVNICMCKWAGIVYELKLTLDGETVCRSCGGEGLEWNQAAGIQSNWPCGTCAGSGVIRITG